LYHIFPAFISVYLCSRRGGWFHSSLGVCVSAAIKKIAASAPSQGVVLGWNRFAALYGGATGGMSADILRAHIIAAAKARRQSL